MGNPYRSPNESDAESTTDFQSKFWQRFALILLAMVALNFVRLFLTWRAFGTDGYEQIGFPFVAFERGGNSYSQTIYWHWSAANAILAIAVAYVGAKILRDGWYAAFRKIQTWGVEDAT